MSRRNNNNMRVFSTTSDENLALIIAKDFKDNPQEFAYSSSNDIEDSQVFLHNTSARAITPLAKWL